MAFRDRRTHKAGRRKLAFGVQLETLEDRSVPATITPVQIFPQLTGYTGQHVYKPKAALVSPEALAPAEMIKDYEFGDVEGMSDGTRTPPLSQSWDGFNFDTLRTATATLNTTNFHGAVAAGPNHVVFVNQGVIGWANKDGTGMVQKRLGANGGGSVAGAFFDLPGTAEDPTTFIAAPKVTYDQYAGRFVVMGNMRLTAPQTSLQYIAVSQTSDPNGAWNFARLDVLLTMGAGQSFFNFSVGSNAVQLSVDSQAIYIAGEEFTTAASAFAGNVNFILPKGIGSGGIYDVGGTLGPSTFFVPAVAFALAETTFLPYAPAQTYGPTPGTVGTYLSTGVGFWVNGVDSTIDALQPLELSDPVGVPSLATVGFDLGDVDDEAAAFLDSAQSGSGFLIETGFQGAMQTVWRNNTYYIATSVIPKAPSPDAGQLTVHYITMDTTNFATVTGPLDQGNVGGEDISAGTTTFFPSIAVDGAGNIAIGFAACAAGIFPGAYYTVHAVGDAPGTVQASAALAAGTDFYVRAFADPPASPINWGRYTTAAVDPADDSIWMYGQYAITRGTILPGFPGSDGRWAGRAGNFSFAPVDTTAPTVTGIFFAGSAWGTPFRTAAGDALFGFPGQTGANQLASLPWNNLNEIVVTFSEPVAAPAGLASGQVGVRGTNGGTYAITSVTAVDPQTWRILLTTAPDTDWMIVDLDGAGDLGATRIEDLAGNDLAGTFTESVSTFPTTGAAGVDFEYRFKVVVGDQGRNGTVRNVDLNAVRNNLFIDIGAGGYDIFTDIDANGLLRNADLNAVRNHLFIDAPVTGPTRPNSGSRARGSVGGSTPNRGNLFVNRSETGEDRTTTTARRFNPAQLTAVVLDDLFAQV